MAQEEEPTLAPYPGHLPNLLMLLLGQMLSIYYLSWALKSIEDISSISGGGESCFPGPEKQKHKKLWLAQEEGVGRGREWQELVPVPKTFSFARQAPPCHLDLRFVVTSSKTPSQATHLSESV